MNEDSDKIVDRERLKKEVQVRLDAHGKGAHGNWFMVDSLEFDDGVWHVVVKPPNGEVSTPGNREILAAVEDEILCNSGVNTNIMTSRLISFQEK
jgi:hypothetical protein